MCIDSGPKRNQGLGQVATLNMESGFRRVDKDKERLDKTSVLIATISLCNEVTKPWTAFSQKLLKMRSWNVSFWFTNLAIELLKSFIAFWYK